MKILLSPSIMCGDWLNFAHTIKEFEENNIDLIHIDIMDGEFVPNYTLGTDFIRNVHKTTKIPLDIHLMVMHPELKVDYFQVNTQDILSFHIEMTKNPQALIKKIKDKGCRVGIAISPDTRIESLYPHLKEIDLVTIMCVYPGFAGQPLLPFTLDKVKQLRDYCDHENIPMNIEVDGNVSFENAYKMKEMGANVFVAGSSSLFQKDHDFKYNTDKFKNIINEIKNSDENTN